MVSRIMFLMLILCFIFSCGKTWNDAEVETYLKDGKWEKAISVLVDVDPEEKYYEETRKQLAKLVYGYNLFKEGGRWKTNQEHDNVWFGINNDNHVSKLSGNVWLYNWRKCVKNPFSVSKTINCNWYRRAVYLDYLGKGKLKIRYSYADMGKSHKYEDIVIWKSGS